MRIRTLLALLGALVVVVVSSYLTQGNVELLERPFRITPGLTVPLYVALLGAFLLGFLPTVTVLVTQTLKRDLGRRRARRRQRERESLRGSFRRALDFQADGQYAKAGAELEGFLAEQPEDFPALLLYGEALRSQGRVEEAIEVHRRASVLYPQSVAVLFQLVEDYQAAGQADVAREIRNRILRDHSGLGLRIYRRRRAAAIAAGSWEEARHQQERIDALLEEAGGTLDPAEREREEVVRRGLAYQRGLELLEGERPAEARALFRGILEADPRFLPAMIMLGEAALLEDDPAAAVAEWRRGYEVTGSPVLLQRIEDHFIEREQPLEAIETVRALIAAGEDDLLPRIFLGRLYYRLEMLDEAMKVLDGLRERLESSPTYHLLRARIHERRGEVGRAAVAYRTALREAGVPASEYVCRVCGRRESEWRDRCEGCGSWNSIEMDLREERARAEEAAARSGPVWTPYVGSSDGED